MIEHDGHRWHDDGHVLVLTAGAEEVSAQVRCADPERCEAIVSCYRCTPAWEHEGSNEPCPTCGGSQQEPGTEDQCWLCDHAALMEEAVMLYHAGRMEVELSTGVPIVWRSNGGYEDISWHWLLRSEVITNERPAVA